VNSTKTYHFPFCGVKTARVPEEPGQTKKAHMDHAMSKSQEGKQRMVHSLFYHKTVHTVTSSWMSISISGTSRTVAFHTCVGPLLLILSFYNLTEMPSSDQRKKGPHGLEQEEDRNGLRAILTKGG
jgi:hypothetical protein